MLDVQAMLLSVGSCLPQTERNQPFDLHGLLTSIGRRCLGSSGFGQVRRKRLLVMSEVNIVLPLYYRNSACPSGMPEEAPVIQ
jgi:hypothetical protein